MLTSFVTQYCGKLRIDRIHLWSFGGHIDQQFPPRFGAQNPSIDKIANLCSSENHVRKSSANLKLIAL